MSEEHDIKSLLGEIKGKMDMSLANQDRMFHRVDGLEERLRHLESHKSFTIGALGVISLLWVVAVEWIKGKIHIV